MIHGADIMAVKKRWHRHNASKYWPSVMARAAAKLRHCGLTRGTLGTLHGENIGQHPVTSCDGDIHCHAVTLCNAESVTLQELVTGVGKCFLMQHSTILQGHLLCCRAHPVHAVDHVPVIVMAEVLHIPWNFLAS